MKRSGIVATILMSLGVSGLLTGPARAGYKMEIDEHAELKVGFWAQVWYQWVENGKNDSNLNDFILRRAYLSLNGRVWKYFGFFTNIASDKVGMEGLDVPGLGLGSGVAWRDLWVSVNLHELLQIQVGRMYVPLTRAYGTTSTKALLTLDLPFLQGGSRGGVFYAQKVGREDSVVLWGTTPDGLLPMGANLQYRFMAGEGVEGDANPRDKLRFAGRVSLGLLDAERRWFNSGTYLGRKKVFNIGAGIDSQNDLTLNGVPGRDNLAWTVDCFFDHPVGNGAFTMEGAYVDINNGTQTQPPMYTDLVAGDDARTWYVQLGYLQNGIGPGGLQPYFRYEQLEVDQKGGTLFLSGGLNYYFHGHDAKITLDYMYVDPSDVAKEARSLFTAQVAVGL